ncbi:MAG: conjugal transfer protein TraD [Planctomycetota bacterium]|jgi:hypothetical protein|nr:conjugal transfer protein TraD [Planctomycetota bacterium]
MSTGNIEFSDSLTEKLRDINTPGFVARLTPDEADEVFFEEPAISDDDALGDCSDLVDALE